MDNYSSAPNLCVLPRYCENKKYIMVPQKFRYLKTQKKMLFEKQKCAPSTFLHAFAPACILLLISISVPPSPQTAPPRYTKLSRCFTFFPTSICFAARLKAPYLLSVHFCQIFLSTPPTVLEGLPQCPLLPPGMCIASNSKCNDVMFTNRPPQPYGMLYYAVLVCRLFM